jgi:hypothetical protein
VTAGANLLSVVAVVEVLGRQTIAPPVDFDGWVIMQLNHPNNNRMWKPHLLHLEDFIIMVNS